jgi:TolB-like protein
MRRPFAPVALAWLMVAIPTMLFAGAPPYRLAVSDFQIQSANPNYQYLGKGFAEFIGIELSRSRDVNLVERERRNELLEEQEFSLSDLADADAQVSIGRLLAADFLVAGSVFEIADKITVTIRLVQVATGEVVLQDKVSGRLGNYDAISASLARLVLAHFKSKVPQAVVQKASKPEEPVVAKTKGRTSEERSAESAVLFSQAIDSYDKKDVEGAKKDLRKARTLDPNNAAAQSFLDRLSFNTSRFKTLTEMYYPNQNPAFLGVIDSDSLALTVTQLNGPEITTPIPDPGTAVAVMEQEMRGNFGYTFPLGAAWGLGAEVFFYHYKHSTYDSTGNQFAETNPDGIGAMVSVGRRVGPRTALGLSVSLYDQIREYADDLAGEDKGHFFRQAFSLGLMTHNPAATRIFDVQLGLATEKYLILDPDNPTEGEEALAPLFLENTLTFALNEKRTYLVLKQTNEVSLDRPGYVGRLIPAVEHWVLPWAAVRLALEGNFTYLTGTSEVATISPGLGASGGFTLRVRPWGLDVDLNLIYRQRPSKVVPGVFIGEFFPVIGISRQSNFVRR